MITINSYYIHLSVIFCHLHSWFFTPSFSAQHLSGSVVWMSATKTDRVWLCSLVINGRSALSRASFILCTYMSSHTYVFQCASMYLHSHVCVSVDVRPWRQAPLLPLIQWGSSRAQGTHQPVTHNYLKDLGESSCPQIIVKTPDSQKAAYVAEGLCICHNSGCSLVQTLFPYVFKPTCVFVCVYLGLNI